MKEFSDYLDEKKRMKPIFRWSITAAVILLLGFLIARPILKRIALKKEEARKAALAEKNTAVPVKVKKISQETIIESIDTNADIEGIQKIQLHADFSGKIVALYVREGQKVRAGQVLGRINRDIVARSFADYPLKTLISGIVSRIHLKKGETVNPSVPVLSVENISRVKCIAKINEKDLGRIKIGNRAEIKVEAYPDITYRGRVNEISPVLDPLSRSGEITIVVNNRKYQKNPLRPGMYAEVSIKVGKVENALLAPYSSVLKDARGKKYLFIYQNNLAKKVYVNTGLIKHDGIDTKNDKIQVMGPLKKDNFVVYLGHQFLNDGDKIRFTFANTKYGPQGIEGTTLSKKFIEKVKTNFYDRMLNLKKETINHPKNFKKLIAYAEASFLYAFFFVEDKSKWKKYGAEANDAAKKAYRLKSKSVEANFWLAYSHLLFQSLKDAKMANTYLLKSLKIDSKYYSGGAYRTLAALNALIPVAPFDSGRAEGYFQKALEAAPKNKWAYQQYAEFLMKKKENQKALKLVQKALSIKEASENGFVQYTDYKVTEKLKSMLKDLGANSQKSNTDGKKQEKIKTKAKAALKEKIKDLKEEIKDSKSKDYEPLWKTSKYLITYAYSFESDTKKKAGQLKEALSFSEKAYQLEPKKAEGKYWYAVSLMVSGNPRMAMEGKAILEKLPQSHPKFDYGAAFRSLAQMYFKAPAPFGNKKKAMEFMKQSLKNGPDFRLNYLLLAQIQLDAKQKETALNTLEKGLEQDGKDELSELDDYLLSQMKAFKASLEGK